MFINNAVTDLFEIEYPIIQAGMVWVSGYRLASAVSESGGLGLIGAGSMKPDLLREHIRKCRNATSKPFGVNIPLLRGDAAELLDATIEEGVKIVFTSAGHPGKFIEKLRAADMTVVHVVSSVKQGLKAQETGCDAVVGEGVEAGGHNGADQITTLCLIPQLADALEIPVIAAGGIADGRQILAALSLGAAGVQIGTAFAATVESSAHENYKQMVISSKDNDTVLAFRRIGLMRMLKNDFAAKALSAELNGESEENLREILGRKREMTGIFEGDGREGAMEAGQSSGLVKELLTVEQLMRNLIAGFDSAAMVVQKMI